MHTFLQKSSPLYACFAIPPVNNGSKNLESLEHFKKQKKILFGFAGRFVDEKGFDILFQAIPHSNGAYLLMHIL